MKSADHKMHLRTDQVVKRGRYPVLNKFKSASPTEGPFVDIITRFITNKKGASYLFRGSNVSSPLEEVEEKMRSSKQS